MGLAGRRCVISPADTVTTSAPVSMRNRPMSSTSLATPSHRVVPRQAGPHPVTDRHAAAAVVVGQRRVGTVGGPPAADAGREASQHRLGQHCAVGGGVEHRQ